MRWRSPRNDSTARGEPAGVVGLRPGLARLGELGLEIERGDACGHLLVPIGPDDGLLALTERVVGTVAGEDAFVLESFRRTFSAAIQLNRTITVMTLRSPATPFAMFVARSTWPTPPTGSGPSTSRWSPASAGWPR